MSFGVTAPPLSKEQRDKKRLAKAFGVCRNGHIQTSENVRWYESVPYCAPCVDAGAVTMTTVRWVYFITDGVGHVKIGYTVDVSARVRELQVGNPFPLSVIAAVKGGAQLERELHRRFAEHRMCGEWFKLAPEIVDYIASLPRPKPMRPEKLKPEMVAS